MRLDNPVKFTNNNIDGTLIARGEYITQYSADNTNWHNEFKLGDNYIQISLDGGTTYPIKYQIQQQFYKEITKADLIALKEPRIDQMKEFAYAITQDEYNMIKNKSLVFHFQNENIETLYRVEADDSTYNLIIIVTSIWYDSWTNTNDKLKVIG